MRLSNDMVDCGSSNYLALLYAGLAEMIVSLENSSTDIVPFGTITTLVTGLALLMLLPAFIDMSWAVARAIGCGTTTSTFAACARD